MIGGVMELSFETTITHNIMSYLNNIDGVIMEKVKGEAECSGRADINGCYKGRSVRIEVKTPDNRNKPSKKQLWNLWQWHKAGAIVMVVYSLEAVKSAFDIWSHSTIAFPTESVILVKEKNNCTSLIILPSEIGDVVFSELYNTYYKGDVDDIQDETVGSPS